jgi:hypothetical protein
MKIISIFNYIDDYKFKQNENLTIIFNNVLVKHYKIDSSNNNNIYSEWIKMDKPNYLNDQQLQLFNTPILYQIENNKLILDK